MQLLKNLSNYIVIYYKPFITYNSLMTIQQSSNASSRTRWGHLDGRFSAFPFNFVLQLLLIWQKKLHSERQKHLSLVSVHFAVTISNCWVYNFYFHLYITTLFKTTRAITMKHTVKLVTKIGFWVSKPFWKLCIALGKP